MHHPAITRTPKPTHLTILEHVPLAPLTTFELGGPARYFVTADDDRVVLEAMQWSLDHGQSSWALAGGSNVVIADRGVDALVIHMTSRGWTLREDGNTVVVRAAAGEPWDRVVAAAVDANLAGIECLSGIPGSVGATPIQNVGAYGQDVAETISRVGVIDRLTLCPDELDGHACRFGYRDSLFKRHPQRYIVCWVEFTLRPDGPASLRYPELTRTIGTPCPTLSQVRSHVLGLRRAKSMVIDRDDVNRRSAGSFFTNPKVKREHADRIVALALQRKLVSDPMQVPRFATADRDKLSAGWLIEHSGYPRGTRRGPIGISSQHALALVHHGGGTTGELLAFAREVADAVADRWDVELVPEPTLVGTAW